MSMSRRSVAILLSVLASSGCALTRPGGPAPTSDVRAELSRLEVRFGNAVVLDDFFQDPSVEKRNEIIFGRMAMIDLAYHSFVHDLAAQKAWADTAAEVMVLGVNLATTVVGGAGTKAVLGAIAGGLTGSKLAVDKNLFYEKTIPALVASMNAGRKQALVPIVKGSLTKELAAYPITQALADLQAYFFAGTILGAIQTVQTNAASQEREAQKAIDLAIERSHADQIVIASDEGVALVDDLLGRIGNLSEARAIALAKVPPVKDPRIDELLAANYPQREWETSSAVARNALKFRVINARTAAQLKEWRAALE